MKTKLGSNTGSNPPACSRFADTPECNALWEGGWTHTRLWELSQKLERERDEARQTIEEMEIRHAATMLHTQTVVDDANELRRTNEGLQLTFDLRWKADQRAIKRWQAAHPGNDLTWPDHADLVVWLMDQILPRTPSSCTATTHHERP